MAISRYASYFIFFKMKFQGWSLDPEKAHFSQKVISLCVCNFKSKTLNNTVCNINGFSINDVTQKFILVFWQPLFYFYRLKFELLGELSYYPFNDVIYVWCLYKLGRRVILIITNVLGRFFQICIILSYIKKQKEGKKNFQRFSFVPFTFFGHFSSIFEPYIIQFSVQAL